MSGRYAMTFTALPQHIDELGHVNNAVWVQWMKTVAVAHWRSVADPNHQDDYVWFVVRHEIDYLRAALASLHTGEGTAGDRGSVWPGEDRFAARRPSRSASC